MPEILIDSILSKISFIAYSWKFMGLLFHPRAGQIFVCDFQGFQEPEMTKIRPVIVVSPKLPQRSNIVAIVPISLTPPHRELPYHYRLSKNYHPEESPDLPCWAKADMVVNLSIARLRAFKTGRRTYAYPTLSAADLLGVRKAVLCGLGLDRLVTGGE